MSNEQKVELQQRNSKIKEFHRIIGLKANLDLIVVAEELSNLILLGMEIHENFSGIFDKMYPEYIDTLADKKLECHLDYLVKDSEGKSRMQSISILETPLQVEESLIVLMRASNISQRPSEVFKKLADDEF